MAEAPANLSGGSEERLLRNLRAIGLTRTAEADVELDEDGRPIKKPKDEVDELARDDSTVIVAENEAAEAPAELFEAERPPRKKKRRRTR